MGAASPAWTLASEPPHAGQYVISVGGYAVLARWSERDRRWFDGYRIIPAMYVRGYYFVPEFPKEEDN